MDVGPGLCIENAAVGLKPYAPNERTYTTWSLDKESQINRCGFQFSENIEKNELICI
jgi:hypothetical protein